MQYSQEHLKTMVYAEFGGQTECIMGNWKIENVPIYDCIFGFGISSLNNSKRFFHAKQSRKYIMFKLFNQNFGNRTFECVRLAIFFV